MRPVSEIVKNEEILKRPPVNNDINNYINLFNQRENLYAETSSNGLKIEYTDVSTAVVKIINAYNAVVEK